MKIYLASRFRNYEILRVLAADLEKEGHAVVSTWHVTEAPSPVAKDDPSYQDHCIVAALRDLKEIQSCDALLLITEGCEAVPGGMWYEAGYAKGIGKAVYIKGPHINIFCGLCSEWDQK